MQAHYDVQELSPKTRIQLISTLIYSSLNVSNKIDSSELDVYLDDFDNKESCFGGGKVTGFDKESVSRDTEVSQESVL